MMPGRDRPTVLGNYPTLPAKVLVALSEERDLHLRRLLRAELAASRARQAGWDAGYAAGVAAERGRWWLYLAEDVERGRYPDPIPAADVKLVVRRWAPRGWRGKIPDGLSGEPLRRWLARLPRKDEFVPSGSRMARIRASWDAAVSR